MENVNAAGEYLQVYGGDRKNGADVKIWNNPERPETQWRIRRTIGSDDTYTLENVYAAGHFLQVYGGVSTNGAPVKIWDNPQHPETQWLIVAKAHYAAGNSASMFWMKK